MCYFHKMILNNETFPYHLVIRYNELFIKRGYGNLGNEYNSGREIAGNLTQRKTEFEMFWLISASD